MKTPRSFVFAFAIGFIAQLVVFAPIASAAPGDLDITFNSTGKVTTPIGSGRDSCRSVAVQSDGKIVVAGFSNNGTDYDFALARFTSTGALDASFGSGGSVTTPIGGSDDSGRCVAVQSDGKIVVAGFSNNGTDYDIALVRYTTTGALDASFGTGGKVSTDFGSSTEAAYSVAVQSDGKIVVAGKSWNGSNYDIALARYTSAGVLDASFGSSGKVSTDFGSSTEAAYSVAVQSDGKILVAGYSDSGGDDMFALVRYTTTGALDASFGTGGKVTTPIGDYAYAYGLGLQSDGNIVLAGYCHSGSSYDFALARYTTTGTLDASFGSGGTVTTDFGSTDDSGMAVAIQSNGKIVVTGYTDNGSTSAFALARYASTGALDGGFGSGGKVITSAIYDTAYSVALQSDGKIVAAGSSWNGTDDDFAVFRYHGDAVAAAPTVVTSAATSVAATAATLNGTVNPNGSATNAWFEYGTTTAYGQVTASQSQGNGTSANPMTANLTGLTPSTLYHYRIAAQGAQTAYGNDVTFTTPSNDANLAGLALSAGALNPAFASDTTSYTTVVTNATTSTTVTPTVAQPNATVKVNNVTVASGGAGGPISLAVGQNTINTVVKAQDGTTTKTYAVAVTRLAPGPQIRVFAGANDTAPELANAQAAAVNFGSTVLGTPVTQSFTVRNDGDADLHFTSLSLPAVYEYVGAFSAVTLASNATLTFQVRFLANTVHGTLGGTLSMGSDDPDDGTFGLSVTAIATGSATPAGNLDPTFGSGGKVTTLIRNFDAAQSVAVQSDGKIVAAGFADDGSEDYFAVARYTSGGALDNSFGTGGKVFTHIQNFAFGTSVALQSDGKIVVAGYSRAVFNNYDFTVARYTTTGALDGSFGVGGVVITPIGTGDDYGYSVAVQSDGKIVVAGHCNNGGNDLDFALLRYTSAGALDSGFGSGGKVTTPIGSSYDYGYSMALQSDGRILVTGQSYNGSNFDMALVRYTDTGALDMSFGSGGKVTTPINAGNDAGLSVVMQSDGKIVVAGYSDDDVALVRYTTAGAMDTGFGSGGKITTSIGSGSSYARSVVLQVDGKIVVAGGSTNGSNTDFALARYTSTGAPDTGFGSGGTVTTDIGGNDVAYGVALQSDGTIIAAGQSSVVFGNYFFALARYAGASYPGPTVATASATSVNTTTATLNGTVNPNGIISSAWFEYGTTTSYGQSTPSQPQGYGTSANAAAATPTGLSPGTLYHYRIVAQNGETTAYGTHMTFTTAQSNNQNWRLTYFGAPGNTGDAADTADPDGDGVLNLMEFATGSNPTSTSPQPGSEVLSGSFIEFTYPRRDAAIADGVTFTVEWSESLTPGSWSNSGVTESTLSDNGTLQQVKAFVPIGSGNRRFVYLKVTSP